MIIIIILINNNLIFISPQKLKYAIVLKGCSVKKVKLLPNYTYHKY